MNIERTPFQLRIAVILGALLLIAPRSRIVIGAPLYLIDMLAFILIVIPLHGKLKRWLPRSSISRLVPVYIAAILFSEMRGMIEYGTVIESIYMMVRFVLAVSVFFVIPRLVSKFGDVNLILKGVIVGTLFSATIVILYSLGPTRALVVKALYSNSFVNPGWQQLIQAIRYFGADEAAMRGRSLVGAATMTAGFLSATWPFSFYAYRTFRHEVMWKWISLATIVVAPIAILMTYGRGAWIMVGVVLILVSVFGLARGRAIVLIVIVGGLIAAPQLDIDSRLFGHDRVIASAKRTIDDPFSDDSTVERLLSYVQPVTHLIENPTWVLLGAGRTGNRVSRTGGIGGQLYDEVRLATHSGFAMAYYSFGVPGAICQVLFIVLGFRLIVSQLLQTSNHTHDQKIMWQAFFMCWSTYSLWWMSGHAMVGEPRGVMLSFFILGLLVAFRKVQILQKQQMAAMRV